MRADSHGRAHPRMRSAGLTLIELVVALSIASAVLAAGYAVLATAIDRREAALEALEADLRAGSARASLRAWLDGARAAPGRSAPLFSGVDGIHENLPDDQLSFLTATPTALDTGSTLVRLFIDRNPATSEGGLVAEMSAWLGTRRARVELVPGAIGLDVRYRSGLVGGGEWLPSWISSSVLPAGLELQIIGPVGAQGLHPLLAYPVRVSLHGGR